MAREESQLTPEEMAYLQSLFAEDTGETSGTALSGRLLLDPSGSDAQLLSQLAEFQNLTLSAEKAGYKFRFRVSVPRPPSGHPVEVRFGVPRIVENRGRQRAARVRPRPDEIRVVDSRGTLHHALVRDISCSGLSLTDHGDDTATADGHVRLRLRLESGADAQVVGRIVRVQREPATGERTLGIEFQHSDTATQEILERFVFTHHPLLHH